MEMTRRYIVTFPETLYANIACAIIINGKTTDWFKVESMVRKGYLLSPTLFCFWEFVMGYLKTLRKLENNFALDISYVDYTTLLFAVFGKLQLSSGIHQDACSQWGLKLDLTKCNVIHQQNIT